MSAAEKIEAYYAKEQPFKKGIAILRELVHKTELAETYKWNFPVYTIDGKNVLGICAFKGFFGVWFFNGVFLSDPKNVLRNAQEGKTKAMRHWNFESESEIDSTGILAYMQEAIENQKKGLNIKPEQKKKTKIPELLGEALSKNAELKRKFEAFTPYKQREFCEHISEAKQEKTKLSRLEKILPMISDGVALHDKYRNS